MSERTCAFGRGVRHGGCGGKETSGFKAAHASMQELLGAYGLLDLGSRFGPLIPLWLYCMVQGPSSISPPHYRGRAGTCVTFSDAAGPVEEREGACAASRTSEQGASIRAQGLYGAA